MDLMILMLSNLYHRCKKDTDLDEINAGEKALNLPGPWALRHPF